MKKIQKKTESALNRMMPRTNEVKAFPQERWVNSFLHLWHSAPCASADVPTSAPTIPNKILAHISSEWQNMLHVCSAAGPIQAGLPLSASLTHTCSRGAHKQVLKHWAFFIYFLIWNNFRPTLRVINRAPINGDSKSFGGKT